MLKLQITDTVGKPATGILKKKVVNIALHPMEIISSDTKKTCLHANPELQVH